MRHARQFRHPMLEECHVPMRERSQQQGRGQTAPLVQVSGEAFDVAGLAGLVERLEDRTAGLGEQRRVGAAGDLDAGAGSGLDQVEMEDEAVVEAVQRGTRALSYRRGRYSPTREQGTHHFHRLIAEFMI